MLALTYFPDVVFRVYVDLLDILLDDVFCWRHFNIERHIMVFRNIVNYRDFHSDVVKFWNLKCSVVRFSFTIYIRNRSVVFYRSCIINRLLINKIYFKMLCCQFWFDGVLLVDIRSWNILFLYSGILFKLNRQNFWFLFMILFRAILDKYSRRLSIHNRLKNLLLIDWSSRNLHSSWNNFLFPLDTFKNGI